MPTPIHVVAGFLGTGKTTAVRRLVAAREGRERCAIVVNDFGDARIDATLLDGVAKVTDIPGGCVCCTAPSDLARTVAALLVEVRPDRIFVEPSGLGRPQDVVDMLARGGLKAEVELGPTLVLVDPSMLVGEPPALLVEQMAAADVLVANRCDLASAEAMAGFRARAKALWPPAAAVIETTMGELPASVLEWPPGQGPRAAEAELAPPLAPVEPHGDHDHDHAHHRHAPSTEGYAALSRVFPPDWVFSWDALRRLLHETRGIVRFKGLFRADVGWIRLDQAGGRMHFAATPYRRDSRVDVIATDREVLEAVDAELVAARVPEDAAPFGPAVALVDADGFETVLTREALAALPGQVADVSAVVPGRAGAGVRLRELFALVPLPAGARFVLTAADGMTSAPTPVSDVGEAVLVHSLGEGPLPEKQGGPFRALAPADPERGQCANVKGVVRIRVLPGA